MSSVWLGWKITRKFLFTLREDDPDENKESTLNNGESSGSASQLSFTNLFEFFSCMSWVNMATSEENYKRQLSLPINGIAKNMRAKWEVWF